MQVSAINSTNFKGSSRYDEQIANDKRISKFQEKVKEIKTNVRPETCLLTAGAIILSVVKGKKIADIAVKGATLAGSFIHAGLKKAGGSVAAVVKGIFKKGDKGKYLEGVKQRTADILANGRTKAENIGKADEKFVEGVKNYVNIFFEKNSETGNKVSTFITEKMGINSKGGLLTGALAGVLGWKMGDGSGDALETILDNKEIKKEYRKIMTEGEIY